MIRTLETFDVGKMKVQEKQVTYRDHINKLAVSGALYDSFSYIEDGKVKAVFGMQPFWSGRSTVWALIGSEIKSWVRLHREVKSLMHKYAKKNKVIRLEMTTEEGFVESERWARMLGFEQESLMLNYGIDGKNHKMWVITWPQQFHS